MPLAVSRDVSPAGHPRGRTGRSLAGRLLRVIFGCYFGVALVVTAGQMIAEYRSAHRRLEVDIQAMQRTFGQGLAEAMWSFNAGVLHGILNGIAEMPVVVGVEERDEHGGLLDSIGSVDNDARRRATFDKPFDTGFDLVYVDENHQSHPVGRWTVHSNDGIALAQVKDTLIVILINSMLKTLALWIIFWVVVHRMVGRPLTQISTFVTRLDAESLGTQHLLLRSRGSHELHLLAQVFNEMATKLRRSFDENAALLRDLKDANATLQARVEERTRDLALLARTDQLTGLSNRRELDERLESEASRFGEGSRFSLIMGDIDHFKSINDRHGHAAGDAVLVAFAKTLHASTQVQQTLGRWGGEEFMILCPGADLQAACALAETMRRRLEETELPIVGRRTCSFGVAELVLGESIDGLLRRTDVALYTAKRNGRNKVEADSGAPSVHRDAA